MASVRGMRNVWRDEGRANPYSPHVGKSAAEATTERVPIQRKAEQEEQARKADKTAEQAAKAEAKRKKKGKAKKPAHKG